MPVVAKKQIVDGSVFERTLTRIAHEILEKNTDPKNICLVGIKTRGIPIAKGWQQKSRRSKA